MPLALTPTEILSLAPDASSAKSGQELSAARKWVNVEASERAVWGECLGSGKEPYRTAIDLNEPAFNCSCPSRKFPCKHSLGLFLLFQRDQATISASSSPPPWVAEWLEKRVEKSQNKQQSPSPLVAAVNGGDSARAQARIENVAVGLIELRLWLDDLVRHGLAELPKLGYSYWDGIAARMIDAQAPGAARLLREMSGAAASGPGWQMRLLRAIAQLHLLIVGFENRSNLPDETVSDIKAALGFTTSQEYLMSHAGVLDEWIVVGQRTVDEEKLRARRTWLYGQQTNLTGLLLHFAHGQNAFELPLAPGMAFDAELVFYPSALPLRAIIKSQNLRSNSGNLMTNGKTIDHALLGFSQAVARNPWVERFPLTLQNLVPYKSETNWYVKDLHERALPLSQQYNRPWHFCALSGGEPTDVFGEFDGVSFWPLSILTSAGVIAI